MPEKVAVVDEVSAKLSAAEAVIITEYRGMSVGQLATLAAPLRKSGGEYKVYKNTLARFAAEKAGIDGLAQTARRTERHHVRQRRRRRRRQGAARCGKDQPVAHHQGWGDGRQVDVRQGRRRHSPTCRAASAAGKASPERCRPRSSRPPVCCRPCRATSPTASRPSSIRRKRSRLGNVFVTYHIRTRQHFVRRTTPWQQSPRTRSSTPSPA